MSEGSREADRRQRLRHDLRSPLTIITGFAELLASDKPISEDTRREYAARIQTAGVELRTLLDAWLDEWVYGLANHREYVEKWGDAHWDALRPEPALSGEVDYGRYA